MKKAFLIGNAEYETLSKLACPKNDVQKIYDQLIKLDFDIELHFDLRSDELYAVCHDFLTISKEPGIVIFYFAGHGFQVDKRNYIAPIESGFEDNFEYHAFDVSKLTTVTGKSVDSNTLIFIDACRDVPHCRRKILYRSIDRKIVIKKGFYENIVSNNTLVMTSTNIGKSAKDQYKKTGLSPFAFAFLNSICCYTKPVNEMILDIQENVEKYTKSKQVPTSLSSLKKLVYLKMNTLPHKHIEFGRRLHSYLPLCSSDPSFFRASVFTSKKRIHADFPSRSDYTNERDQFPLLGHTLDRYSVSWEIPEDKEVTAICNHGYFFCCGTNDGWVLFQHNGTLYGFKACEAEIWYIDVDIDLKVMVLSTAKGVLLDRFQGNVTEISGHTLVQLSNNRSLASGIDPFKKFVFYSETSIFNETQLFIKDVYSGDVKYQFLMNHLCECYCLKSIGDNKFVGATSSGLIFWDFSNYPGDTCQVIKNQEESYPCLSLNKENEILVAATSRGTIEYWDIQKMILLQEVKVCVSDIRILSLAWTNTNAVIVTTSDRIVLQIFNSIPEMPTEDYLLEKYDERHARPR